MYATTWLYKVRPEHIDTFKKVYGKAGDWARLFARHPGFLGTRLYGDLGDPSGFVTIDTWTDKAAFDDFMDIHGAAYQALDARYIALSEQWHLGATAASLWTGRA